MSEATTRLSKPELVGSHRCSGFVSLRTLHSLGETGVKKASRTREQQILARDTGTHAHSLRFAARGTSLDVLWSPLLRGPGLAGPCGRGFLLYACPRHPLLRLRFERSVYLTVRGAAVGPVYPRKGFALCWAVARRSSALARFLPGLLGFAAVALGR